MKLRTMLAAACIAATTLSVVAFAENDIMLIAENPAAEKQIFVNGEKLDASYLEDDGVVMIPVRKVCESLGFTVTWNSETNDVVVEKMPLYYTFNVYKDGYTISRTAPYVLGKDPQVVNCTTYVPLSFVNEILPCVGFAEDGIVNISSKQEKVHNTVVFNSETEGMLIVYDAKLGDVIVNVSEETIVEGDLSAIEAGQVLDVVYDDFMTLSLPPITNALEVKVLQGEYAEKISSVIVEVTSDENTKGILIGNPENATEQIFLNVSENTVLLSKEGEAVSLDALQKGMKITSVASNMATRSLPPQRNAYSIRVTE